VIKMRESILAAILFILVFAFAVGMPGNALADTYTFTGLGGRDVTLFSRSNRERFVRGNGERPIIVEGSSYFNGRMAGCNSIGMF
jgi:hypothetical protein